MGERNTEGGVWDHKQRAAGSSAPACSADLLPCPFCGRHAPGPKSGAYMIAVADGTAVRCPTCNAHGPTCPTFDRAIAQWNTRKQNTAPTGATGQAVSDVGTSPLLGVPDPCKTCSDRDKADDEDPCAMCGPPEWEYHDCRCNDDTPNQKPTGAENGGFDLCCGKPPKVTEWRPGCWGAQCMECGRIVGDERAFDRNELMAKWNNVLYGNGERR